MEADKHMHDVAIHVYVEQCLVCVISSTLLTTTASDQIRKIADWAWAGNSGNVAPSTMG